MHEQQSWPDDLALASLRHAAAAFVDLDSTPTLDDLPIAVECAVNLLCRAIEQCEDAGIDKWEILAQLGDARALHARSPFIARAQNWPRGYPGDFETIEYLCAAENRSLPQTLPHALEELALRSSIAGQHRNKVAFQAQAILAACRRTNGRARILSIGCGGCRDIRSIASTLLATDVEFVLCDIDYEALDFALHALGPLAGRCTYLNATVPRVLRKLLIERDEQDVLARPIWPARVSRRPALSCCGILRFGLGQTSAPATRRSLLRIKQQGPGARDQFNLTRMFAYAVML